VHRRRLGILLPGITPPRVVPLIVIPARVVPLIVTVARAVPLVVTLVPFLLTQAG
jgi:hypothetical protein